jgi:hypothetical protein
MDDPQIGPFIQEMAHDPDVTYWIFEHPLPANGGGKTNHCDDNRFDIWVDLDFHKAQEGSPARIRKAAATSLRCSRMSWVTHGRGITTGTTRAAIIRPEAT